MQSFTKDCGKPLVDNDYPIVFIYPNSKKPEGKNWTKKPRSAQECLDEKYKNFGVGILCGYGKNPIIGIDADIHGDEALATRVKARWQKIFRYKDFSFVRVGKAPSFLIPAITSEPINKIKSKSFKKDGVEAHVEILGKGEQFVAYAHHKDTQQPYKWTGNMIFDTLYECKPRDLPLLSNEKISEIIKAFEEECAACGYTLAAEGGATIGKSWENQEPDSPPMDNVTLAVAKEILFSTSSLSNADYDTWVDVGMALHYQFNGSVDAKDLWAEWSQKDYKGFTQKDIEDKWPSFGKEYEGKKITFRSIYHAWKEEHRNKIYTPDEEGLANVLTSKVVGNLRYVAEKGVFYGYSRKTGLWSEWVQDKIIHIARRVLTEPVNEKIKALMTKEDLETWDSYRFKCLKSEAVKTKNMVSLIKGDPDILCSASDFDIEQKYISFGNGVFDLELEEFSEFSPERMLTRGTSVFYDPSATCPLWEKTLLEIMDGKKHLVDFLQRSIGYALTGRPSEHVMFFLIGNGCNGKSVFLNTLGKVLGSLQQSVKPEYITQVGRSLANNANNADSTLMKLEKARMCVCSETEMDAVLKEATIKQLVSTDRVVGRGLYEKNIREIEPTWVFFLATNHVPKVKGQDAGVWRRIVPIQFTVDFNSPGKVKDIYLEEKLKKELSGILNWVLDGYSLYRRQGLDLPEEVKNFGKEVKENADILASWLKERCVFQNDANESSDRLWRSYKSHTRDTEENLQITRSGFLILMEEKGFVRKKNSKGCMVMTGIRLKTEADEAFDEGGEDNELME